MNARELGHQAKRLLEDDLIVEAFKIMETNIFNEWRSTVSADEAGRESCYRQLKGLSELQRYLRKLVDDGKIEEINNG